MIIIPMIVLKMMDIPHSRRKPIPPTKRRRKRRKAKIRKQVTQELKTYKMR